MKKMFTQSFAITLVIITILSFCPAVAFAAEAETNYKKYEEPPSSSYVYWNGSKMVKSGMSSSNIKYIQAAFNFLIKYEGLDSPLLLVDASYGPSTAAACRAFQKKYGLTTDSSCGPDTLRTLKSVLKKSKGIPVSITAPANFSLKPGSSATLTIQFEGDGIDRVNASLSGAGLSAKFTGSSWKASGCSATVKLTASSSFRGGTFTFMLVNDNSGTLKSQKIQVDAVTDRSTSSSGYKPKAAIDYAKANVYKNSEQLCAEYVSRAVRAGGLNISIEKGVRGLYNALTDCEKGTWKELKVSSDGRISLSKNKGLISVGDPILLYCDECVNYDGKPWCHAVLASQISGSYLRVYAHNKAKNNETYYNICYIHDDQAARAYVYQLS